MLSMGKAKQLTTLMQGLTLTTSIVSQKIVIVSQKIVTLKVLPHMDKWPASQPNAHHYINSHYPCKSIKLFHTFNHLIQMQSWQVSHLSKTGSEEDTLKHFTHALQKLINMRTLQHIHLQVIQMILFSTARAERVCCHVQQDTPCCCLVTGIISKGSLSLCAVINNAPPH